MRRVMDLAGENRSRLFTVPDLRRRAEGVLRPADPPPVPDIRARAGRSDFDLDPDLAALKEAGNRRLAAVLIPVLDCEPEARVLFTLRTDHLPSHGGQVSFPGGKIEEGDAGPAGTALREAWEEIGLDPAYVEVIGFLDDYQTSTGYRVSPAVGIVRPGYTLVPDGSEVADVFDVPLGFLMNTANHERRTRPWRGGRRTYYAMPYGERFIWGATAGMLRNLYDWLYR